VRLGQGNAPQGKAPHPPLGTYTMYTIYTRQIVTVIRFEIHSTLER